MRWFKFMCDESEAEFEAWLVHEHGMEGFGRWVKLQQIVARTMNKSPRCSAVFPLTDWGRFLVGKPLKLVSFLKSIEDRGEIVLTQTGQILEIAIPNLLKKRDEYTAKSGQDPDKNSAVSGQSPDLVRASVSVSKASKEEVTLLEKKLEPEEPKTPAKKSASRRDDRATRVPEPFVITLDMRAWAAEKAPRVDLDRETEAFVDYWRGVPGSKGRNLDWPGTWRNRMRAVDERLATSRRPPSRAAPAQQTLTPPTKPTRGRYDDYFTDPD